MVVPDTSDDSELWNRIVLIAAVFLTFIVLSGIVLMVFSDFFLSLAQ